jgi:hypothetical protein
MSPSPEQLTHSLFCGIDARETMEVECALQEVGHLILGAKWDASLSIRILRDVVGMFNSGFAGQQAVDTPYHDLEHTLQTSLCWAQLSLNWTTQARNPALKEATFETGLAAVLLHDVGYMKDAGDFKGTGAKHTVGHEQRSCSIASRYLNELGWSSERIQTVAALISCTGPQADFSKIEFDSVISHRLGQMVCTADYLGQMADPSYARKIPSLFSEFQESDCEQDIPYEDRDYKVLNDLLGGTGKFWSQVVLPRLNNECDALYKLLDDKQTGTNAYLEQVQENLSSIDTLI